LSHIFGFCDYKKIIYGVKHTLNLTIFGNEDEVFKTGTIVSKLEITNITWTMINIIPNFEQLHSLNKLIESKKTFPIGFMYRKMEVLDVQYL